MVRDFINIDSSKIKDELMNTLDMKSGDLSGNKLGLSSKIIPVVSLGFKDFKAVALTEDNFANGARTQIFKDFKRVVRIFMEQDNTETDAKNFTIHAETLGGQVIETQLALTNSTLYLIGSDNASAYEWTGFTYADGLAYVSLDLFVKNLWISQDSADGTAQNIQCVVHWYE